MYSGLPFFVLALVGLLIFVLLASLISKNRKAPKMTKGFAAFLVATVLFFILGVILTNESVADYLFGEYAEIFFYAFIVLMLVVLTLLAYVYQKQVEKKHLGLEREQFWLFKIDPERFRIFNWWQDHPNILNDSWYCKFYKWNISNLRVRQWHFHPGDKVAIWVQGAVPGIYALGEVTKKLSGSLGNPLQEQYWKVPHEWDYVIEFKYTKKFFTNPLTREHEYLRRFPLVPIMGVEKIEASLWEYIEEKLGLKDPDLQKKTTIPKEVISHSAWLERTKKSAFRWQLVGAILFVSGLAISVVMWGIIKGEELIEGIGLIGMTIMLWGVVLLFRGHQIRELAKARP